MNWNDIKKLDLVVYSTAWCSDCIRLKMVFDAQNVSYKEIDIDNDTSAAAELQQTTGRSAIPFVKVNGDFFIRGWHKGEAGSWNEDIFFAEVEEALQK